MDEGSRPAPEVTEHIRGCRACGRFEAGAWRLREISRFAVAPEVPDLTERIMNRVRAEAAPARRPPAWIPRVLGPRRAFPGRWIASPTGRAAAVALVIGFAAGATLARSTVAPRQTFSPALAREIPGRLIGAAERLRGYRATFDISERDWTPAVPHRTFVAEVEFRAPESFRVTVRDTTRYPAGAWPRNDLTLVTDGRSWRITGPQPCPRAALPACPDSAPADRTVVGRAPFDASTAMPTDVIVPMTVLAASGRVDVIGTGAVAGREAVMVQVDAQDGGSLLKYLQFLGSWRPFFPQDRMVVWLDRRTWFPLRYEVLPAPGAERAAWASQNGLPAEAPERPILSATVVRFTTGVPPANGFAVRTGGEVSDQGFRDRAPGSIHAVPPRWVGSLRLSRAGTFSRAPRETVLAYSRGLSWVTVTSARHWTQHEPFGVGPFAERIVLPGGAIALYEPASATDPRRISIHTSTAEFLVASNLPRPTIERVAASLPVTALPEPASWRVHRWAGGVVEDGLTPAAGLARAGFGVSMPAFVPAGYEPAAARLVRTPGGRSLTILFRHPAAELGDGLTFTQGTGQTLAPPSEVGVLAVHVGRSVGRWSPSEHLLEWMDGARYRSLASADLGLATLVRVAQSLRAVSP